jgi:ABC-2 type transport system permease protein
MNHVLTIAKKELRAYFNSPLAYLFINVFLVVLAWLFFQNFFLIAQASMRNYFAYIPWILLFLIPAITMRLWAEEKKLGTIELLLTSPVKDEAIVLGKFFASVAFLAICLALSFMVPVVLYWAGSPDTGVLIGSYLGSLFLGSAYIAIGMWLSAYTDNQIIAFILAIVVTFFFFIIGEPFVLQKMPGFLAGFFDQLGIGTHFESMSRGVLDSRDILYYLSFIGFFLFLNVRQISSRRFK